jgi:hypothetical protein
VFWAIVAIFCIEAGWIALSSASQIFDETYHFTLINYMSTKLNPFLQGQENSIDNLGAAYRTTSILYYSLFGYFFALVVKVITSLAAQVILLRLIHIIFFVTGAYFVKKSLELIGLTKAQSNFSILILLMLPVTSFLAATINYDNALLLIGSINIYFAIKILKQKSIVLNDALLFLLTGFAAILVKYTFLPIFIVSIVLLLIYKNRKQTKSLMFALKNEKNWNWKTIVLMTLSICLVLISFERYLVNVYQYGGISAQCAKALSVPRCEKNQIYTREVAAIKNDNSVRDSATIYFKDWAKTMVQGTTFVAYAVDSNTTTTAPSSKILKAYIWLIVISGLAFFFYSFHKTKKNKRMVFVLIISVTYLLVLFLYNYLDYKKLGVVLGVQSRYMLIVLPYLIGIIVYSATLAIKSKQIKAIVLVSSVAILLLTGGFVSYIKYSDQRWYWNNSTIIEMNKVAKKIML